MTSIQPGTRTPARASDRRRAARGRGAYFPRGVCVLAAVMVAGLTSAGPAAAGTNASGARCDGTRNAVLSVDLAGFNPATSSPNWIKVDDNSAHLENTGFGQTFRKTYRASPADNHVFHIWVWSNDDPNWQYGRSFYAEYRVAVCAPAAPPPTSVVTQPTSRPATTTPRKTTSESTTPGPSTEPPVVTTSSTEGSMVPISVSSTVMPVAVSDAPKSPGMWILPLIIGMVLLAGGLTVLLLFRRRTSPKADHTRHRPR